MEAYLDNSATTRVDAQVQELMKKLMDVDFGNPSSRHQKGVVAEGYIKEARQKIAATLKVDPKELIITSGGTESNNMALIGTALAAKRKGNHIITTAVEHPSVKATASFLEEQGFRITFLSVDSRGQISLEELKEALTPDTILVSIMYVNNEIGTIQPIEEAAKLVHATALGAVFHVDAIQAYGKVLIRPKQQGIDLLSVSSHKFHGPKGAGFLYCSSKVNLHPIIFGGGQQSGMRSGTENVPGAAGMGLAAQLAYQKFEQKKAHLNELRRYFLEGIHKLEGITVNGWDETVDGDECLERRAPHIVSVSFSGVRSEVLLNALSDRGIYVSSGSACSSNHPALSTTLQAIGLEKPLLEGTLRFSFCENTTKEELDEALAALKELLPMLRRYTRRQNDTRVSFHINIRQNCEEQYEISCIFDKVCRDWH